YPIQTVALVACHELGGTGVGRQHAFFDELVGIVAYHGLDALDATEVGTYDTRLDRIEIDGTTFDASRRKQLVKLVQVAYVRHERTQRSRGRAVGLLQGFPHLGIGAARMRMNDGVVKLIGSDLAGLLAAAVN